MFYIIIYFRLIASLLNHAVENFDLYTKLFVSYHNFGILVLTTTITLHIHNIYTGSFWYGFAAQKICVQFI